MHQTDRAFGLSFAVLFTVIGGIAWLFFDSVLYWTVVVAVVFLAIALVWPSVLMPLNRLWRVIATRIAHFNNYLLLGIFFVVVIVPAGVLMRLFRWDPMNRTRDGSAESYWTPVPRDASAETLRDPF